MKPPKKRIVRKVIGLKIKLNKRKICIAITVAFVILMLAYQLFIADLIFGNSDDEELITSVEMIVTRALGGGVFITIIIYLGYKILNPARKPFWRSLLFCLPAFCVVINNLPIYPLASGIAQVTSPIWRVAVLATECLMVGFFEETCFRGVFLIGFLEKRRDTALGRFLAIVFSSAVFGAVHLVNILLGSSPIAVIMQIGYSFLIGAMCSVVLMKTANLWLCVILHATFNFCGALVPSCGEGTVWDPFTITITVIIAVATTVYMTLSFLKIKTDEVDRIYK